MSSYFYINTYFGHLRQFCAVLVFVLCVKNVKKWTLGLLEAIDNSLEGPCVRNISWSNFVFLMKVPPNLSGAMMKSPLDNDPHFLFF